MKKFVLELVSNRFGIVLAALNVFYLAGHGMVQGRRFSETVFLCANAPAALAAGVSVFALDALLPDLLTPSGDAARGAIAAFCGGFIALQWLFVAWSARRLAARLSPNASGLEKQPARI